MRADLERSLPVHLIEERRPALLDNSSPDLARRGELIVQRAGEEP
jgi:hypothetical protein